jgi:uncharacterized protein (TIGR00255 family)
MTGYGKSVQMTGSKKIQVEIRTLNSKSFDLSLKFPPVFREKEAELRTLLAASLERGKIDVWISLEDQAQSQAHVINTGLVQGYYDQLQKMTVQLNLPETDVLPIIFRFPDVVRVAEEQLDESTWLVLQACLDSAMSATQNFRAQEGKSLEQALRGHVMVIDQKLVEILPWEKDRIPKFRERLQRQFQEWLSPELVDQNRLEQEIIYYLEKFDISEEKIRLSNHCQYFLETLDMPGYHGKKLNFIAQEMGREINTLGSKANDARIQKAVVVMKDELEKIKEQVLNAL